MKSHQHLVRVGCGFIERLLQLLLEGAADDGPFPVVAWPENLDENGLTRKPDQHRLAPSERPHGVSEQIAPVSGQAKLSQTGHDLVGRRLDALPGEELYIALTRFRSDVLGHQLRPVVTILPAIV
jgi:hypothetical protein